MTDIQELVKRIDELICTIQQNNRYSFGGALTIFLTGIGLTLYLLSAGTAPFKDIPDVMKLGPGLISMAVCAIPSKFYFESRERLIYYKYLKNCGENSDKLSDDEILKLKDEIRDALKEIRKRS